MVSGSQGQLVTDIIKQLAYEKSFAISSYDRQRLDVTDKAKLEVEFRKINPDFFIQGASYHVVEEINKNPKEACDVNIASLHYLVDLCNEYDCTLINFSTNYVFSGHRRDASRLIPRSHLNYTEEDIAKIKAGLKDMESNEIETVKIDPNYIKSFKFFSKFFW